MGWEQTGVLIRTVDLGMISGAPKQAGKEPVKKKQKEVGVV
jgi:hypothetical protein